MNDKDQFLYVSLGIGFLIVAIVFFYDDYSFLFDRGDEPTIEQPIVEDTNNTQVGDVINGDDATASLPTDNTEEDLLTAATYIVKEGDTAFSIARAAGITIDDLQELNKTVIEDTGLEDSNGDPILLIRAGTELKLR